MTTESATGEPSQTMLSIMEMEKLVSLCKRRGFLFPSPFPPPDVSKAPGLVGPVTDLLTFYADLFLAIHGGPVLRNVGDRFYFENPVAPSWADGKVVILGED